jgi:hypothetical protein
MADLMSLTIQFCQHAHSMENIIRSIHIPENINQAGHSNCKEYLNKAMEHMIKMGDAYASISAQHPQELASPNITNLKDKQEHLVAQLRDLTATLWERSPTLPLHSTLNSSASEQSVIADTSQAEAKKMKEATIQASVKYDQLKLDLGHLITGITAYKWTHSEDHIVTLGMRSRSSWREQHATLSKKLIEVEGLARLHDLMALQDLITNNKTEVAATSTRMDVTILEIETTDIKLGIFTDRSAKTCPIKLPTYSGILSEDFITFKDKF